MNDTAALGFAPHSGWTVLVALGFGAAAARPRLLARERIELADAEDPGSKQPYHAIEKLPLERAEVRLASFQANAERLAHAAIARVVETLAGTGAGSSEPAFSSPAAAKRARSRRRWPRTP